MAKELGNVTMQVRVDRQTAETIADLADALQISPTQMAARLLREAAKDNAFIIKWISRPLDRAFKRMRGRRSSQHGAPATAGGDE